MPGVGTFIEMSVAQPKFGQRVEIEAVGEPAPLIAARDSNRTHLDRKGAESPNRLLGEWFMVVDQDGNETVVSTVVPFANVLRWRPWIAPTAFGEAVV